MELQTNGMHMNFSFEIPSLVIQTVVKSLGQMMDGFDWINMMI